MTVKNVASSLATDGYIGELIQRIPFGKTSLQFRKKKSVFSQGDPADALYFIESGRVKITVTSAGGKEGVLAILGPRDFLGEESLIGEFMTCSATVMESAKLFRIERDAMLTALDGDPHLSRAFISGLVVRNVALEENLCDQLFNSSEKRLARILLKLARLEQHEAAFATVKMRRVSHETLAEMVGTTRPHITQFMIKFRRLGLIEYDHDLLIRIGALNDILHQEDGSWRRTPPA